MVIAVGAENLGRYSLFSALNICLDAAKGMGYIHSTNLIHRDLKSNNIVISKKVRGKVADYGESREKGENLTMTSVGTPLWMAPEVSKGERYDFKADVYSFGVILFEVCKCELPYKGMGNAVGIAVKVALEGLRPTIEEHWHPCLKVLMEECYDRDSRSRPTFQNLERRLARAIEDLGTAAGNKVSEEGLEVTPRFQREEGQDMLGLGLWGKIRTRAKYVQLGMSIRKVR